MSTQNQPTNEPSGALVDTIASAIWEADPQLRFVLGRDQLDQRVRSFLASLRPQPEWGEAHGHQN